MFFSRPGSRYPKLCILLKAKPCFAASEEGGKENGQVPEANGFTLDAVAPWLRQRLKGLERKRKEEKETRSLSLKTDHFGNSHENREDSEGFHLRTDRLMEYDGNT